MPSTLLISFPTKLLSRVAVALFFFGYAHTSACLAVENENQQRASMALHQLFHDSDEAYLKRNPLNALYRGDMRYADQFGDYISDAYYAAEKMAYQDELTSLLHIDRNLLNESDRISYDVFKFDHQDELNGLSDKILAVSKVRPIDHFYGMHLWAAKIASGNSIAPFKTVADYDNNIKRLKGYMVYLDRARQRMQEGIHLNVTNPALVMNNVVDQLTTLINNGVEESPYFLPVKNFPADFSEQDKQRLTEQYTNFIRDELQPAQLKLRDFIKNDYLPVARKTVGLSQMPGGAALYRYKVRSRTTTELTPDYIHQLGLSEVNRIHAEMEKVKTQTGFVGTLTDFYHYLRTDPQFAPASADAMRDAFLAIDKKVEMTIPREFSITPKTAIVLEPTPSYMEKTAAGGSYMAGTPDGSRAGKFNYNTYDLPSRYIWGYETLFLHEGVPGHHFQISLANENSALPAFQRFGGNTAYVEGWALYAESLGTELGMYTDPYQMFGHLNDEILRAMRLVVDTGIHAKGWSREQAIKYMLDNSAMSTVDATAEVERYIAIPGQALAYKIGQLTIRRLRSTAEKQLGARFNLGEFHQQVLMSGALPMKVLEAKINDWIKSKKG